MGAYETRMKLLTLKGQWLEKEGRVMAERAAAAAAAAVVKIRKGAR